MFVSSCVFARLGDRELHARNTTGLTASPSACDIFGQARSPPIRLYTFHDNRFELPTRRTYLWVWFSWPSSAS